MKSRVAFIILFFSVFTIPCFAYCIIKCDVKYLIIQDNLPSATPIQVQSAGTYSGTNLSVFTGGNAQLPLNAMINGATSYGWSNTYTVNVIFYSGYEANQVGYYYPENAIIALIPWANGGYSVIQIQHWGTQLEVMTEKEVSYDTYGNKIDDITGIDAHGVQWAIQLDN